MHKTCIIKNVTFIGVSWLLRIVYSHVGSNVKTIFCKKSAKSRLLRVKIWRIFGPETPHSEFEGTKPAKGTCITRTMTFEPLSVQLGPILRPVGWPRKPKKRKKRGRRKSQNRFIILNHHVEAPFRNRSAPNLASL